MIDQANHDKHERLRKWISDVVCKIGVLKFVCQREISSKLQNTLQFVP